MANPRNVFDEEWTDTGRVLMQRGNRRNAPDASVVIKGIGDLLKVWELNRQHRLKMLGRGKRTEDRLRGLFGGG